MLSTSLPRHAAESSPLPSFGCRSLSKAPPHPTPSSPSPHLSSKYYVVYFLANTFSGYHPLPAPVRTFPLPTYLVLTGSVPAFPSPSQPTSPACIPPIHNNSFPNLLLLPPLSFSPPKTILLHHHLLIAKFSKSRIARDQSTLTPIIMSKSRMPLILGLGAAGGVGYYLYNAGGNAKACEKKFESTFAFISPSRLKLSLPQAANTCSFLILT